MSRTQIILNPKNKQQSSMIIDDILNRHDFEQVSKKGEDYWQQGIGVTQSPKFIKYYFEGDKLILEGWVKNFGRESDLSGFVGSIPKRTCKKILNEITKAIENENQNPSIPSTQTATAPQKQDISPIQPAPQKQNIEPIQPAPQKQDTPPIQRITPAQSQINQETLTDDLFNYLNEKQTSPNIADSKTNIENTYNQAPANIADSKINIENTYNQAPANIPQNANKKSSGSKPLIPKRFRGNIIQNVFEIIIAIIYLIGASSGYLVLRFTDSSEALMVVAIIILIHGVLSFISNLQDS